MQISNFNAPPPSPPGAAAAAQHEAVIMPDPGDAGGARGATELALLRVRIEHLELVVETARGLMTANQERLLRRLHDVPQEMMMLTAKITRFTAADPAAGPALAGD